MSGKEKKEKREGELVLHVYFHRALNTDQQSAMVLFHVNDTTEQAIEKIIKKIKADRVSDDFALFFHDKTLAAKTSKSKGSKKGVKVASWVKMADGSNLSTYGLIAKDKIEIRPKNVISFQFPDDTTKTIPCDFKSPISEILQIVFEDDDCKRFAGCYLYDGETKLDHSLSLLEQGVRYNATLFFRPIDIAPQNKRRQANLTNYRLSVRISGSNMKLPSEGFTLSGSATETPEVFIEQMKSNISDTVLIKFHTLLDGMPLEKREGWVLQFVAGAGIDLLVSVISQIDAAMIKLQTDLDMLYQCLRALRICMTTQAGLEHVRANAKRLMRLVSDQLNTSREEQKLLVLEMLPIFAGVSINVTPSSKTKSEATESVDSTQSAKVDLEEVVTALQSLRDAFKPICNRFADAPASSKPILHDEPIESTTKGVAQQLRLLASTVQQVGKCLETPAEATLVVPNRERGGSGLSLSQPVVPRKTSFTDPSFTQFPNTPPVPDPLPVFNQPPMFPIGFGQTNPMVGTTSFGMNPTLFQQPAPPLGNTAAFTTMPTLPTYTPTPPTMPFTNIQSAPLVPPSTASSAPTTSLAPSTPPDPIAEKLQSVRNEANLWIDRLQESLQTISGSIDSSAIQVAKAISNWKAQIAVLNPLLTNVVNTPFEPGPGKDKIALLKDATRLTISDMKTNLELARQLVEVVPTSQLLNLTKALRSIQPIALS